MEKLLKAYSIQFSGLKEGKHEFEFELNKEFFEVFDFQDGEDARFRAHLELDKKVNRLDFKIAVSGEMLVHCDLTDELFWLPLENKAELIVKFGEEFDDTDDEILVIPHGEHSVNLAQPLYELIVLAKPLKVVHPDVAAGKKGQETLERLQALSPDQKQKESEEEIDPRWNKLKDLLD
jgi:uncharacterized metal-binding protein YceD (DUF177 family)